ncbi:MAG: DUF4982 domain-containing protein [Sedimentisphaerales bacterium]|nr:DUF4982 domain-containing protein [Sedimentisphaerales bacterium]
MKNSYIKITLLAFVVLIFQPPGLYAQRSVVNFNREWKFARGEQDESVVELEFDDSDWQAICLPHDWAISGPFNPEENGYAGKLPWKGVGWYRKTFALAKEDNGKRVYFDFDGVMAFPRIYVNGQLAGEWDYGYMSFRVDATPYVRFGQTNVIAVEVDTRQHGTRWYPGAGIYRKVTMTLCDPVHVAGWGTFVTTPEVSDESAKVRVRSTIENHQESQSKVTVEIILIDPDGRQVATGQINAGLPAGGSQDVDQTFKFAHPRRWDIISPNLYTARVRVHHGDKIVDTMDTSFGIRTFQFTADDGFHLNGRRVQLYGVNLHHDHGPLGAAFYTRAMERQLEIMRELGCNSIRTSHNPSAPELLELCDRMGFVLWDECFDKWNGTADRIEDQPPLEEHGKKQIRNLVLRDRNHPCVVVWSIGNEIVDYPHDKQGKSPERVKFMSDFVREYDSTRPVGIGCCYPSSVDQETFEALDLTGWNYGRRYARYRQKYPDRPIIYSESASALSTRGFYELPHPKEKTSYSKQLQVDSYDMNSAPWSDIADAEFALMEKDRFVAGEYVWTGFDYLGEPTPFSEEARSSYFGIVDLCGIPKDRFYLYRSYWRPDTPTVHILPHWNWPDYLGKNVPVFVYTNGDSAELFLNGKSLGRRTKGVIPARPANLALNKPVQASSTGSDHATAHAVDNDRTTRWCAQENTTPQWWQVDLGEVHSVGYLVFEFDSVIDNLGYEINISSDASSWETLISKDASDSAGFWKSPTQITYEVDTRARYIRMKFTELKRRAWPCIKEVGVYAEVVESSYYLPTYTYRLRWDEVIYEPGELKAVAYRSGREIGQAVMRTAGEPAVVRLTPDRDELRASGEDLCYILVEALDEKGTLCPLADNLIHFEVEGPVSIAGVGNGNPLSFEPFQAEYRKLFNGKAMLILRTLEGQSGSIHIIAHSEGLQEGHTQLQAKH